MKKITKLLMLLLTYAPITSVAVVAQAKVSELVSEDQTKMLIKEANTDSSRRLSVGQASEEQMLQDIRSLIDHGLIRLSDDPGSGGGPSHYAI